MAPINVRSTASIAGWLHAIPVGTAALFAGLVLANLAAWCWAFAAFADRPAVMGTALLAWVLGLRHAVDADHIAAIDNVVRKLMHTGEESRGVGLYFSLGHSTVVVAGTILVAMLVQFDGSQAIVKSIGGMIGTSVSAAFLLLIAAVNLAILAGLWRTFSAVRKRGVHEIGGVDGYSLQHGLLGRLLSPMFRLVSRGWHMYPLGLLFGLGFDTATEVGLLSLSAAEAARGTTVVNLLVFPALFTAAMTLVDTADSALMTGAYRWALVDPLRKLWYNLTITASSVIVALFIGGVEALNLLSQRLGLEGGLWAVVAALNENLADFGFVVIGLFVFAWLASIAIYRLKFDERRSPVAVESHDGGGNAVEAI